MLSFWVIAPLTSAGGNHLIEALIIPINLHGSQVDGDVVANIRFFISRIRSGDRYIITAVDQRALRELQCHMGLGGLVKGLGDGSVHLGLYLLGIQRDGAGCAAFVQIIAAAVFHGEDLCLSGGLDPFLTCLVADGKAPVARNRYRIGELGAAQEQRRLIFSGRGQGVGLGRGAGSLDRPGDGDGVAVGKGRCLSASVGYFQCAEVCRAFMDGQCKSLLVLCSRPLGGAVIVTDALAAFVGVPLIAPELLSSVKPSGKPSADHSTVVSLVAERLYLNTIAGSQRTAVHQNKMDSTGNLDTAIEGLICFKHIQPFSQNSEYAWEITSV